MKKVKYIGHQTSVSLTHNRIYDVVNYDNHNNSIVVINDYNVLWTYYNSPYIHFIDATEEYRGNVIDGILK